MLVRQQGRQLTVAAGALLALCIALAAAPLHAALDGAVVAALKDVCATKKSEATKRECVMLLFATCDALTTASNPSQARAELAKPAASTARITACALVFSERSDYRMLACIPKPDRRLAAAASKALELECAYQKRVREYRPNIPLSPFPVACSVMSRGRGRGISQSFGSAPMPLMGRACGLRDRAFQRHSNGRDWVFIGSIAPQGRV